MSIIQEALKKAQGATAAAPTDAPRQPKAAQPQRAPGRAAAPAKPKVSAKVTLIASTVLLIAAIAAVAGSLGPLLVARIARQAPSELSAPPAQEVRFRELSRTETEAASGGAPAVMTAQQNADLGASAPKLVLNGIMYLEEGPRAIVNNSMVEVGEYVGGAKVVSIDRKNVVLVYDEVEITLTLK